MKMTARKKYPANWKAVSLQIRYVRAAGRCECTGECGLHRTTPGPRRCVELDGRPAKWARGKVMLTVAHLNAASGPCSCDPLCANLEHLKAMCNRCHLRYDAPMHQIHASDTRDRKRGQMRLPGIL